MPKVAVLSGGTDGTDGPTDAAGAVVDGGTVARGRDLGMEARAFLDANDSYHFFEKTGELLKTGPTHTNVMDIRLVMAG
jgi:hydroxypyruvate reductase